MCRNYLVPALLACMLGCASAAQGPHLPTGSSASFSNVLLGDEIRAANMLNALEAIRKLRPWFLRSRGLDVSVLYVDGIRYDRFLDLTGIFSETIVEVRHLSAAEAQYRFGAGHPAGAILVTTGVLPGRNE